jgi:hypothetical protein
LFFPQQATKAKIEAYLRGELLRIMFQDELRFGRINIPRSCWAPPGIRPVCGQQIVREYTYAYIGVSPKDGRLDSLILPNMYTPTMSVFLEEISQRYSDEYILMIMDGAPCHISQDLNIPDNIMIVRIPPHSPQLNPCENMFDEIREKFFPNLVFDSMDAVEKQLVFALNTLENSPHTMSGIAGWEWILKHIK